MKKDIIVNDINTENLRHKVLNRDIAPSQRPEADRIKRCGNIRAGSCRLRCKNEILADKAIVGGLGLAIARKLRPR